MVLTNATCSIIFESPELSVTGQILASHACYIYIKQRSLVQIFPFKNVHCSGFFQISTANYCVYVIFFSDITSHLSQKSHLGWRKLHKGPCISYQPFLTFSKVMVKPCPELLEDLGTQPIQKGQIRAFLAMVRHESVIDNITKTGLQVLSSS